MKRKKFYKKIKIASYLVKYCTVEDALDDVFGEDSNVQDIFYHIMYDDFSPDRILFEENGHTDLNQRNNIIGFRIPEYSSDYEYFYKLFLLAVFQEFAHEPDWRTEIGDDT